MIENLKKYNPYAEKEINLHYIRKFNDLGRRYKYIEHLHFSRSENANDIVAQQDGYTQNFLIDIERSYKANLKTCLDEVSNYFKNKIYDAIICAPSSTQMHQPFYDAIIDGTGGKHSFEFQKTKSAGASKNFCEYYQQFEIKKPFIQINTPLNKLLIVDDIYARGYTTGAVINKLEENNINVEIIDVFTPLIKG